MTLKSQLPIVELPQGSSAVPPRSASRSSSQLQLDIEGMHCASCVARVEEALLKTPGVAEAHVNLATNEGRVSFDAARVKPADLLTAVERAGYRAAVAARSEAAGANLAERSRQEVVYWRNRLVVSGALLVPLVALDLLWTGSPHLLMWLEFALATPIQMYAGWPYFLGAARRLVHWSANMDTLVALGSGAAYAAGVAGLFVHSTFMPFHDGAMILTFITLGKYLEARAKGSASASIWKLLALAPPEAIVISNGTQEPRPVEAVRQDETILIRPGDKIPLDADVLTGTSDVDEAWLTGEPLPVAKLPGSRIFAGSVNGQGSLTARVVKTAGETTLSQTVELVKRAQESKAGVQRLADVVVAWFVPFVLALAVVTLLAWGFLGATWPTGFSCAVAVLVVACPCAMGLATPMAMLVGGGLGAQRGILIKNMQALETAGRLSTVVLDKTGTITRGRGEVVLMLPAKGRTADELLSLAAAAESLSSHPLARAVLDKARENGIEIPAAENLRVHVGEGIEAHASGGMILAGDERLLSRFGIAYGETPAIAEQRSLGCTPLFVALAGQYVGALVVADPIETHALAAVDKLKKLGLSIVMLSGDKQLAAEAVAREVGIAEVIADVRPDEKQNAVRRLQSEGKVVAMVGDGINDAPALAAADLGIALASGADVAIESADLVIVRGGLASVPAAIRLSRAVLRTIWQNLGWAFAYNLVLLPLAAGVLAPYFGIYLPPALAAAAMAASSVSVVANSLLLRWKKI